MLNTLGSSVFELPSHLFLPYPHTSLTPSHLPRPHHTSPTPSQIAMHSGGSSEELVAHMVTDILQKLPPNFDIEKALLKYPVMYEQSLNQVRNSRNSCNTRNTRNG